MKSGFFLVHDYIRNQNKAKMIGTNIANKI